MVIITYIKNQWKKDTFNLWGIIGTILCFSYFFGFYLVDCLDGLVGIEAKTFIVLNFVGCSFILISAVVCYFVFQVIAKRFGFLKRLHKNYDKRVKTVLYMFILTVFLAILFQVFVNLVPKYTEHELVE